jgi:hypothetical protein
MKKFIFMVFIFVITVMVSSIAIAKPKQNPSGPPSIIVNGTVINACYQKINGQLRVVSDPSQCRPSEIPVSWNIVGPQGPQGPTGVVATTTFSGNVGTISADATQFAFAGTGLTMKITTTASQRITGVIQAPLGTTTSGVASFEYDLCYRTAGTSNALTNFTTTPSMGEVSDTAGRISFTAAASVVPGAGTWEVGYCVLNSGAIDLNSNDILNGWAIVTEE